MAKVQTIERTSKGIKAAFLFGWLGVMVGLVNVSTWGGPLFCFSAVFIVVVMVLRWCNHG